MPAPISSTALLPQFSGFLFPRRGTPVVANSALVQQINAAKNKIKGVDPSQYKQIRLVLPTGGTLNIVHFPAQGDNPTIVFSNGVGADINCGYGFCASAQEKGYGVLLYDYPGVGLSTPRFFELLKQSPQQLESSIKQSLGWASDYLEKQGVPTSKQILAGWSFGTGVTINLAQQKSFKAVVLLSPFSSLPNVLTFLATRLMETRNDFSPYFHRYFNDILNNVGNAPMIKSPALVVLGEKDVIIPPEHSRHVFEALGSPFKKLLVLPEATHYNFNKSKTYHETLIDFLEGLK